MNVHNKDRERGAAVVEFALIVPLLLLLVLGIAEFGRAYNVQTTLSGAARAGVRVMALQNDATAAKTATKSAAVPLALSDAQIVVSANCPTTGTANATVTVSYPMVFITNFFGPSIGLTGKAVMRCNG